MTNWMTAAGLALIAGGLATLIGFRSVLFSRGPGPDDEPAPPEVPIKDPDPVRLERVDRPPPPTPSACTDHTPAPVGPTEIVLSWPPVNTARLPDPKAWSARDHNSAPGLPRAVVTGRDSERPTVVAKRSRFGRNRYVSRHAAEPPR